MSKSRVLLDELWEAVREGGTASGTVPREVRDAIERAVNSSLKTYRYVPLTQLIAKAVDASRDARAVQERADLTGSFDARSLCKKVVVPFDRRLYNVLGGSGDPYVSNPLRIPALTAEYRSAQQDPAGFDDLVQIAEYAQQHPQLAAEMVFATLLCIQERLKRVRIVYPVPNRVSLKQALRLIEEFTQARSGGVRMQALAVALFRCIGRRFDLFEDVTTHHVNTADISAGRVADLECVGSSGDVILAAEVKDRKLSLIEAQTKLPTLRERGIEEFLFLIKGGVQAEDEGQLDAMIDREYSSGQNIYVCEFNPFVHSCLSLFGEEGRREFLLSIGNELDERADLAHREAWRDLLETI